MIFGPRRDREVPLRIAATSAVVVLVATLAAQSRPVEDFHRRPDIVATLLLFGPEYAAIDITPYGRKGVVIGTAKSRVSVQDVHAVVARWSKPAELVFLLAPEHPYISEPFLVPREALAKGGGSVRVGFFLPDEKIGQADVPKELVPVQEGQSFPSGSLLVDLFARQSEGLTRVTPYSVSYPLNNGLMVSYINEATFKQLMSILGPSRIKAEDYFVQTHAPFTLDAGIVAFAVLMAAGIILAWRRRT